MKQLKLYLLVFFGLFLFADFVAAQSGQVVIYNDVNFQGANAALTQSWKGGGGFDRNIKSIRVPRGYIVTIYEGKNYKGVESRLTEDWNPGAGAYWFGRIRSIRIDGAQIQPPIQPPSSGSFPVIYAQPNFQGPAEAIENGYPGRRDWEGSPHRIRSIRVPAGWKLTLYTERNYRGTETTITSDISWEPGAYWNGRARSIRVSRETQPPTSGSFPVIYAQANLQGPAEAIERDFAGHRDWEGSPHRIRSIRVPQGWYLVVYDKRNFRGKSYNVNSDWTPQPGDYWYGRIKSIKVYQGKPPIQPR